MLITLLSQDSFSSVKRIVICFLTICLAIGFWLISNIAWSQAPAFKSFPLPERFQGANTEKLVSDAFKKLVTTRDLSSMSDRERGMASFYLNRYLPWKLTQKENLPIVAKTIRKMGEDLARAQRMGTAGAPAFLSYWFQGLKAMAEGDYMPATRINAAIALGRLRSRTFDPSAGSPPQSYSAALPVLLALYENQDQPDGVRAAALQGLANHTKFGFVSMPSNVKLSLAKSMQTLLRSKTPEGRQDEAHAFMQRYAVDVLRYLLPTRDTSFAKELVSVSADPERSELITLYAASHLGDLPQSVSGAAGDPKNVLPNWSKRALACIESEIARLEALERPQPVPSQPPSPDTFLGRKSEPETVNNMMDMGSMGMDDMAMMDMGQGDMGMEDMSMLEGMDMMGAMGMGMMPTQAKPQPPEVDLSRRYLNSVFQTLLLGACGSRKGAPKGEPSGLMAAVPDDAKPEVSQWIAAISPIVDQLNNDTLDTRESWLDALQAQRIAVASLAGVEIELDSKPEVQDEFPDMLPGLGGFAPDDVEPALALPGI